MMENIIAFFSDFLSNFSDYADTVLNGDFFVILSNRTAQTLADGSQVVTATSYTTWNYPLILAYCFAGIAFLITLSGLWKLVREVIHG